ncbi:MAG: SsrA-binding protein SmpB [Sedimentisphaerales bacterium]|nr:SsrA-binding protein SmpB [Sedimentisphaerales bacterium]
MICAMSAKPQKNAGQGDVSVNKKAFHNFEIEDRLEAGMELMGSEVKSLRDGQADLSGSYARIINGECWLLGTKIAQYQQAGLTGHNPTRKRKLLLHRHEIRKIYTKLEQRGFTLVPLRIYFNQKGIAKIELALARGKRKYDKRQAITEREQKKDIEKRMKKYRS